VGHLDGVCLDGGMFNNYAIVQGVDQLSRGRLRPGVPPSPETLMHAILTLHEQIRTGAILRRPAVEPAAPAASDSPWTPEVAETVRLGTPT